MLLRRWALLGQWEIQHHLYSHLQGTFLDNVLGHVDAFAKEIDLQQQPQPSWVSGAQELTMCFTDTPAPHPY